MPLENPPAASSLSGLPKTTLAGRVVHRVFRARRCSPWWFSTVGERDDPRIRGRFDLAAPLGSCYLALSAVAAVVEAFQDFGSGLLPEEELRARRRVQLRVPAGTPPVVNLAAARLRGLGATAALWAGEDRQLTQAWAAALHRAGWHGVQYPAAHDPTGRSRSVAVFGPAGGHLPFEDPAWSGGEVSTLHDDEQLRVALRRFGIMVTTSDVQLPMVELGESGLLGAS